MPRKKIKDNLQNILQVKNSTETSADLYFYGDIVSDWWGAWQDEDQYPMAIKNFLDGVKGKDLNVYINCGGGSVFAGMAIYNMISRHQGFKTVYVDGVAASIASVIALAGDKVIIPSNAYFMIHKPMNGIQGNADDMREMADALDKIQEGLINVYADHLNEGVDIKTIEKMVNAETWMTGADASKYFAIEVSSELQAVASMGDVFKNFSKTPPGLRGAIHANEKNQEIKNKCVTKLKLLSLKGAV